MQQRGCHPDDNLDVQNLRNMVLQTKGTISKVAGPFVPFKFVPGLMDAKPVKAADPEVSKPLTPVTSVSSEQSSAQTGSKIKSASQKKNAIPLKKAKIQNKNFNFYLKLDSKKV